jgi:Fe-S cluster biosynthesis and repair protein YggX
MADKRAQQFLMQQMDDFLFGPEAPMPEGWVPEGETPTAPAKGGAPRKK